MTLGSFSSSMMKERYKTCQSLLHLSPWKGYRTPLKGVHCLQAHKVKKKNAGHIRAMHPTSVKGVDDMIMLGDLNEAGLLRNLLVRHKEGIIYTYTGSILVAVNPYQLLPIYTTEQVHMYTDRRLGELPPHVFAIADTCFFNMRRNKKSQCCVISGESGAGKTESTKLMLQFLAAVSGQHSWIEQQILEANPILEAFGNAKTIRNDNSSRFGKYIDVNFTKGGAIEGARVEQYLLEKSRVCRQAPEERNYHIFYYMVMGMSPDQKKILSLGTAAEYKYLTMGNCTSCEGRDDVKEYAHFRSALKILMFTETDSWEIFKLLAALLHLGNVEFESTIVKNLEGSNVASSSHFNMASKLLEVDPAALEKCLTQRSVTTARDTVNKPLNSEQALDGRDAFVKAIYGRLFIWVVTKINTAIYKPPEDDQEVRQSIGLLDIFGFENFHNNSFEQLCINFANEQLQQFFVKHVFKLEQDEYNRENILWTHIDYQDNQSTLDILATKPLNVLALIDEESNFPKGTDTSMLLKLNQIHSKGTVYIPPKNDHETKFGIQHFAGRVDYDSKGFLEKNRDTLSLDLIQLVDTSSNKLLRQTFSAELGASSDTEKSPSSDGKKRVPTLSAQFRQSLDSLMKTLTACQPYFIRCIKPNDYKKPMLFDRDLCVRQLRYSGMMETIKIRKAGYPVRYTFSDFLNRYRVLLRTSESKEQCCESICRRVLTGDGDWKTGKTKIFLKDFHDTTLELERMKELHVKALVIQRVLKGYKYRREFLRKRSAAIVIQKNWRGYKGRKQFKVQLGFARLQALSRSRQLHLSYLKKRQAALVLQTHIRGYLARKEWKRKRNAVILLQAHTRSMLAKRKLQKMQRDEVLRQKREMEARQQSENISDQEMVDNIFGFLPNIIIGGQEGQAPVGLEVQKQTHEIDIDELPLEPEPPEEDYDDLDQYSFTKFASIHFQGAATHSHIRQRLQQPLLYHEDEGDVLASLTVWWIILRFLGDLPEPKRQNRGYAHQRMVPQDMLSGQDRRLSHMVEELTLDRPLTSLEKVHYIVGYGIIRPDLRDEIYCQICKQLHENSNRNSYFRGWILLSLCLGVFPPSQLFLKYLQSFIRFAPGGFPSYLAERLRRTLMNGARGEPPAWLELQATKTKKRMLVNVALLDGRAINLPVDSASTSREVCQLVSNKIKLRDAFGFSLYVAMYEKVRNLASMLMMTIWRLVQVYPCFFCFRTEIFFFKQTFPQEDDLIQLAAKHLYIQHGSDNRPENVKETVRDCIKNSLIEAKSEAKLVQMIHTSSFLNNKQKPELVKAEMVDYARDKWPMFFSRFYEVTKLSGPVPKSKFIVAINWTGITFLDEREKRLMELSFPEVMGVNTIRYRGSSYFILSGASVEDMAELTTMFLSGLTERSVYAVALKDVNSQDDPTILSFKKGELIILIKDDEFSKQRGWIKGQNSSNKKTGAVSTEAIHILPTLSRPSNEILSFINLSPNQRKDLVQANQKDMGTMERVPPATLKEYSLQYFRLPLLFTTVISRNAAPERLWAHSREPIRQPLHMKLLGTQDLSHKACMAFTDILCKYMGDYPTRQMQSPLELTDQIFSPPTQSEALRDEIYCQIMKQMTSNNNRFSIEQGWQLLWLCCGLFPPSQPLLKHTQKFLESRRREPLASDCLQRLQSSLRSDPRKLPPHQVEVEAIQQNSTQILHKVYFPNDTDEVRRDLIQTISKRLQLASADGFSLFMKTQDKVLGLNEADYFFDSLRQITDWSKRAKRIKEGGPVNISYHVFFMRKLWFNVVPGRDIKADLIFHFPQELPKYLRGYHVCTKEDMVNIAAMLFLVKVRGDKSQIATIPKVLKELVPADQLKAMSENEWKKFENLLLENQAERTNMKVDEAKIAFLKAVCRWPTFGCAFFEVKQTSEPDFPDIVRIAISKTGLTILHPKTKDVLANHPYNKIASWCSGSTYFHMTVGSLVKGNKFLCETSLGYKMDDLITSYVNMYLRERTAQSRGHRYNM
uniref:Myosin VIIB n=1 Tax=Cyprinodon variegatus TaxID=28743 RepID=A0A3Q2CYC3_CYPVA